MLTPGHPSNYHVASGEREKENNNSFGRSFVQMVELHFKVNLTLG